MDRIVINDSLLALLRDVVHPVELCDEAGRVIGEFVPRIDQSEWEAIGPELSTEELLARVHCDGPRYTTTQVIEYLQGLDKANN